METYSANTHYERWYKKTHDTEQCIPHTHTAIYMHTLHTYNTSDTHTQYRCMIPNQFTILGRQYSLYINDEYR